MLEANLSSPASSFLDTVFEHVLGKANRRHPLVPAAKSCYETYLLSSMLSSKDTDLASDCRSGMGSNFIDLCAVMGRERCHHSSDVEEEQATSFARRYVYSPLRRLTSNCES